MAADDREAFYRRYDKAVAALPAELRSQADFHTCGEDKAGIHFYDQWGAKYATVGQDGKVSIAGAKVAPEATLATKAGARPARGGMTSGQKEVLVKHIQRLNKSASTALSAIENIFGRLEKLEQATDDGFRYRGYWRAGMEAARGDAYTDDGNIWWAVRATKDRPRQESPDWMIAVRKGRDAR